jgi:L,D-peptidoglycan transpeptidase YkuD (ErfK/YbiS/YcfS/YnhG family)
MNLPGDIAPANAASRPGGPCPKQLILVCARGSAAQVYCFNIGENGEHRLCDGLDQIAGYIGKNGLSFDKREGDGCTPAGLFRLGHAFGCRPKPDTAMDYRSVTPVSFWVDDPVSHLYNTWVEGTDNRDWSSAEHLCMYPDSYACAVVIEYNMHPVVPGRGSAVFLHCGTRPTAGCVAVPEDAMYRILKWLDPHMSPCIQITSAQPGYSVPLCP